MQGLTIENISNLYKIKTKKGTYEANARGKFKKEEITPVVGDKVEIQILDEENKKAVIEEIQERTTYIKRPKMSSIKQKSKTRFITTRQTISICRIFRNKGNNSFEQNRP